MIMNKVTKNKKTGYRLPNDLLLALQGKRNSDKLSGIILKFPRDMREKLISDDTLYEHYGKKKKDQHISIRMTQDESDEIKRLQGKYKKSHTKIFIILATASLYSEDELKKLLNKRESK